MANDPGRNLVDPNLQPARTQELTLGLEHEMAAINFATNPYRDAFNIPAQQFFAGFDPAAIAAATPSMRPNPQYRMANNYQPRRSITLQARLTF